MPFSYVWVCSLYNSKFHSKCIFLLFFVASISWITRYIFNNMLDTQEQSREKINKCSIYFTVKLFQVNEVKNTLLSKLGSCSTLRNTWVFACCMLSKKAICNNLFAYVSKYLFSIGWYHSWIQINETTFYHVSATMNVQRLKCVCFFQHKMLKFVLKIMTWKHFDSNKYTNRGCHTIIACQLFSSFSIWYLIISLVLDTC